MSVIKFTQPEMDLVLDFADKIDTSYYASRSQSDSKKRKNDQIIGKLGEVATFNYLKDKYPMLTPPDFRILSKKDKSWDFDLKAESINLHVKSQDLKVSKTFGESWTFQRGSATNKNFDLEIFERKTPNQYASFVIVDLANQLATIKAIVEVDFLFKKDLFKLPVLSKLRDNNKSVVYYRDMKEFTTKLWAL